MKDIPSPIDLKDMNDAREWANKAFVARPYRTKFLDIFSQKISQSPLQAPRVLELGSGPGFLIERILRDNESVVYTALDFSEAMHQLARERLGRLADKVSFCLRSFKEKGWYANLGEFDFVITMQAVHELRHKEYVPALLSDVRSVLSPGGTFLYCDHHCGEGGLDNSELYMLREEQHTVLNSHFSPVSLVYAEGSLILWEAGGLQEKLR